MKKIAALMIFLAMVAFCFSQERLHSDILTPETNSKQDFPQYYDLRTYGWVTPVKDQGNCGSCWAFASMAAVESNWLKMGYGTYDLSEDNLINCQEYDNLPCDGGNFYMSSAMFGKHSGPVLESQDPYQDTFAIKNCPMSPFGPLPPTAYAPDVRFLPGDINTVKQAILDHGAVAATMIFDMGSYNSANYKYCYNGTGGYPHCITVIGWNDTLSFPGLSPGAWIIKDSYGTSWANNGYFYISYQDPEIFTETAIFPLRYPVLPDNETYAYYYDAFGWINNTGFSSNVGYGLAHYIIGETFQSLTPQQIKRIGTYAVEPGTTLDVEIYSEFQNGNLSGLLAAKTRYCEFAGFYTIPVNLHSDTVGTEIYVKITYDAPGTANPIPIEEYEENYTSGIVLQTGRCWMSGDASTWHPVGNNTSYAFDLCIKMYAETAPLSRFTLQDTAQVSEPVLLESNCFPMEEIDSLHWLDNGYCIGNMPLMYHPFALPGEHIVSLVAFMGSNSDTSQHAIFIKDPIALSEHIRGSIRIYPNPAKNRLYLVFPGEFDALLVLRNMQGSVVDQSRARIEKNMPHEISLESLRPGIYILEISMNGFTLNRKIIVTG
ncbi:MAG: C1 family peptidase [Bacteroidales bacterium]